MAHWLAYLKGIHLPAAAGAIAALTGSQQLFFLLALLCVFLYGMSVGKTRAILSLLAIYGAFMLTELFPFWKWLQDSLHWRQADALLHMSLFLLFYAIVFAVLNISSLRNRLSSGEISFWQVLLVSAVQVGFLAAVLMSFAPADALPKTLQAAYPYMGTPPAVFGWSAGALAILPLIRHKRERSYLD
jgi:hypothetical protein